MPNLVGIGLSQVPTNSMLGGMAYQDPDRVKIKKLHIDEISQINSEIADTATDIFVYDTSRDSDGGAWRKRTTDRSWYNETLGTSTRGTRKEFPAVAVIVAEATKLTIYDGDDPNLPMWMVFNLFGAVGNPNSNMLPRGGSGTESDITSVVCLNGRLAVGLKDVSGTVGEGLVVIDFISELSRIHRTSASGYTGAIYNSPISGRNSNGEYNGDYNSLAVVAETINDVAMTVLPNAPIDSATDLPIPTIAVATDGGVSVIKDDGIVVNITSAQGGNYNQSKAITITEENYLWWLGDYNSGSTYLRDSYAVSLDNFPSSDFTWANTNDNLSAGTYYALTTNGEAGEIKIGNANTWAWNHQERNALGGAAGLAIHKPNIGSETNSLIVAITSDYNTGYMLGDNKGAFLSDTDDTDAVVAYSDGFSNNDKGWSFADNGSSGISGGNLTIEQNSSARATDSDALNGVATGTKLTFTLTVSGSGTGNLILDDDGAGAGVGGNTNYGLINATGSYTFTANKTASNRLRFIRSTGSNNYDINFLNISTEYDRSINDKGLGVFGTVPKSAVATGADLVAYGAFGTTNYLKQPYNSDLAPGTGAYSVTCWFKTGTSTGDQYIFDRASGSTGSRNLLLIMHSGASGSAANKLQWWHRDSSNSYTEIQVTDKTVTDDVWHQVVALYDGLSYKVYVDGIVSSNTSTVGRNVGNDGSPPLYIGVRHSETAPMTGKLALFRYSKSAPTAEQVKKMYNDEKHLFQENAKCTLYGSSNAVTGLAHDDSTDILHVGTSAGRSEFQGLRRINNTTTAVTTAISAHDEFIIEQ